MITARHNRFPTLALCLVAGLAAASNAHGATVRGTISATFISEVNIQSPVTVSTVDTAKFTFNRNDTPGTGVDTMLGRNFTAFCVEANQTAVLFESNTYNVASSTEHGLTGNQETLLSRLWGTKLSEVDTLNESTAFQLAIWEIVYDTNLNVSTGTFFVTGSPEAAAVAQGYLNMISAGEFSSPNPLPTIKILESSTRQDLITGVANVPAAGTGIGALAGLGLLAGRRRR